MERPARKTSPVKPPGVIDVRKVKTAGGGEGGRTHLTWVIAYSERIAVGSPGHDAIRTFAATLKAPRGMDASVMLLPVVAREPRELPAPAKAPAKVRARPAAKKPAPKTRAKPRAKPRSKPMSKPRAKTPAKAPPRSAARKPARRPRSARR